MQYDGALWSSQDILTPINNELISQENWITNLEAEFPMKLIHLDDVNINPNLGEDGKFVKYDFLQNKFILDSASIQEPPNNNIGHLWRTTAGTSSWIQLTSDGEYSATKSKVLANEGNISVIQSEQITQDTNITNL